MSNELKLNVYGCVVCGEGIWWSGKLPPACNHHTYKQVYSAVEKKTRKSANKAKRRVAGKIKK